MPREYKKSDCINCGEFKFIAAKGACRACYNRYRRNGTFEKQRKRNICSVEGCEKNVVTRGLCDAHRKMQERRGTTESSRPEDWGKRTKHPLHTYWMDIKRKETINLCAEWAEDFWEFVVQLKIDQAKIISCV